MTLFIIVLCLLSERFLIHSLSYQRFYWLTPYYKKIKQLADKNSFFANPWLLLLFTVAPILLITLLLYFVVQQMLFGILGLLLSFIIFFYCLGPQNVFYPIIQSDTKSAQDHIGDYFVLVNRQLFSLVFWYILAGPIGALAYRLITQCRDINDLSPQANELTDLLEWIPARLTVLLFLLVGNFQRGFSFFIRFIVAKPELNREMLRECGLQAVRTKEAEEWSMPRAEGLVEHAIIVMLVFIALFTLVSWL